MVWSHKLGGFRKDFSPDYKRHNNPYELAMKDVLFSERTSFLHMGCNECSVVLILCMRGIRPMMVMGLFIRKSLGLTEVSTWMECSRVARTEMPRTRGAGPSRNVHQSQPEARGDHRRRGGRHPARNPKAQVRRIGHNGRARLGGEHLPRVFNGMV